MNFSGHKCSVLWTLFVVALWRHVDSSETVESDGKIFKAGVDAEISCDYYAQKTDTYYRKWTKTDVEGTQENITDGFKVVNINDKRISVSIFKENARNRMKYVLKIKNIKPEDSGTYTCHLYYMGGNEMSKHFSVFVFPTDVLHVAVVVGDDAHLACLPERFFPISDVTWTKGQEPVENIVDSQNLIIPSSSLNDSATYTCKSVIDIFETDRYRQRPFWRDVHLEVVPLLEVTVRNDVLYRPVGYDVNVTCFIRSLTPVYVTWLRDEINSISEKDPVPIASNDTSLFDMGSGESKLRSVKVAALRLRNITESDYGRYVCEVFNELDIKRRSVQVTRHLISSKPDLQRP